MDYERLFLRYGAELYNIILGALAIVVFALLAAAQAISIEHWLYWSALSLSFLLLPLGLIGLRRLSPKLDAMMEITGPEEKDGHTEGAAGGAVADGSVPNDPVPNGSASGSVPES